MIQITLSVVNRNAMPLTPYGVNLYVNEIFIPKEIGSKLLRVGVGTCKLGRLKLKGQE